MKIFLRYLLFASLFFSFSSLFAQHPDDVANLKLVYNDLITNSPDQLLNWDLGGAPLAWEGVAWQNERVVALWLQEKNLKGTLNPAIENLSELQFIRMAENGLTGSVPKEIGNLINMIQLDLSDNFLEGAIPESVGNMEELVFLGMSGNQLTAVPASIGNLKRLKSVYLNGNQFTEVPKEIAQADSITTLILSGNQLTVIPEEIGNLKQLLVFGISDNQLESLPASIWDMTTLGRLLIDNNKLTTLPDLSGRTSGVRTIMAKNNLFQTFPDVLKELSDLNDLYLNGNPLSEVTGDLSGMSSLTYLEIMDCALTEFPAALGTLPVVQRIRLDNNELSGSIPEIIRTTSVINYLHLNNNQYDTLPEFQSESLIRLSVPENRLTFSDLEHNRSYFQGNIDYAPQKETSATQIVLAELGEDVELRVDMDGTRNLYAWYFDNNRMVSEETETLRIPAITRDDFGDYYARVSNSLLFGLELKSDVFQVVQQVKFMADPVVTDVNLIQVNFNVTTDKNGTVYYVLSDPSVPAPTKEQLKAGQDGNGNQAIASGDAFIFDNVPESVAIQGLSLGTSVQLHCFVEDEPGLSSTEVKSLPVVITGSEEITSSELLIYPNPATSEISIENYKSGPVSISTIQGKVIWTGFVETSGFTLSIEDLAPGVYLIRNEAKTIRMVKQ